MRLGRTSRIAAVLLALAMASACGDNDNNDNGSGDVATPTPTPTPTSTTAPPMIPCPAQVTYIVQGDEADFDTGWSGIYFDAQVGTGGSLTFAVGCPGEFLGGCGECPISGPIASTTVVDNRRCVNATEVTCTSDADCPGSTCAFFFGAPLPISGGGFPICVTNEVTNDVTGTIVPELGSGASDMDLLVSIHSGLTEDMPCPICDGPGFDTAGVCVGGPRDGQSCTVHGTTALYGNTSFDCPPNPTANIGDTEVPIDLTTGTRTLEPTVACTGPAAGLSCYCAGQQMPNACSDGICTVDAEGEGTCLAGPVDQRCAIETFRGCLGDSDCPADGDACEMVTRKCLGQTDAGGDIVESLVRTGEADTEHPLQVGVFCIDATTSPAVNAAGGLPGPAGVRLPTNVCIQPTCG